MRTVKASKTPPKSSKKPTKSPKSSKVAKKLPAKPKHLMPTAATLGCDDATAKMIRSMLLQDKLDLVRGHK